VQVSLPAGTTVRAISAGSEHSLALTTGSQALAWGGNFDGQLGDGSTVDRSTPVAVQLPPGLFPIALGSGSDADHTLAIVLGQLR
jgi:alpha-tubulin suppressor-like RCC1 family protein